MFSISCCLIIGFLAISLFFKSTKVTAKKTDGFKWYLKKINTHLHSFQNLVYYSGVRAKVIIMNYTPFYYSEYTNLRFKSLN